MMTCLVLEDFFDEGRHSYGSKYHCWKRLQRAQEARAEADVVARHDEAMAAGAADVQVPGRPVEPLSERARETQCVTLTTAAVVRALRAWTSS